MIRQSIARHMGLLICVLAFLGFMAILMVGLILVPNGRDQSRQNCQELGGYYTADSSCVLPDGRELK